MTTPIEQQIKQAIKGNAFRFGSNREIRRLPEYLHADEQVLNIITGSRLDERGRGIIVATDERVLFIWDGWVFRENQDFPYETISSMEFKTNIFFGTLTLYGKGDEISYNWVDRFSGDRFTKLVRQQVADANKRRERSYEFNNTNSVPLPPKGFPPIGGPLPTPPHGIQQPTPQADVVLEQISKLGQLRDQGYISLNDYEIKKQHLLNQL